MHSVRCSHCQASLKLKDDRLLGKKVACPKCRQSFVVSLEDEPDDLWSELEDTSDPVPSPPRAASPARKRKRGKQSNGLLLVAAGAGLVLLLIGGGLAFWLSSGDDAAPTPVADSGSVAPPASSNASGPPTATSPIAPPTPVSDSAPPATTTPTATTPTTTIPASTTPSDPPSSTDTPDAEIDRAKESLPPLEVVRELSPISARGYVYMPSFSPDGQQILGVFGGALRIWRTSNGRMLVHDNLPAGRLASASFSPEGSFVVAANDEGTVWAWDPFRGDLHELAQRAANPLRPSYTVDGSKLVLVWGDGHVKVLGSDSSLLHELTLPLEPCDFNLSPDSQTLTAVSKLGLLAQANLQTGAVESQQAVEGATDPRISPDGTQLAWPGNEDQLFLLDRQAGAEPLTATFAPQPTGAFRSDKRGLLVGCSSGKGEGGVFYWSPPFKPVRMPNLTTDVHGITWDRTGKFAAATCSDRLIRLWEVSPPYVNPPTLSEPTRKALVAWKDTWATSQRRSVVDNSNRDPRATMVVNARELQTVSATLTRLLQAMTGGDVVAGQNVFSSTFPTPEEARRLFGADGPAAFQILEKLKQATLDIFASQCEALREVNILSGNALYAARDLRLEAPSKPDDSRLLAMIPEDVPVFETLVTLADGTVLQFGTFVVFDSETARLLPPWRVLATEMARADAIHVEQIISRPMPELAAAGKAFLGSKAGEVRTDNGAEIKLVWCPAGTFHCGTDKAELEKAFGSTSKIQDVLYRATTPVEVTLTEGFWIGQTEITEDQWKRVMGSPVPSSLGPDYAAANVSWRQATAFCRKLTQQERAAKRLPPGWIYELPTEFQWEYACRAGTTSIYSWGNSETQAADYAWFGSVRKSGTRHPVAQKQPNAWGCYDMYGNVMEWCRDRYDGGVVGGVDPLGPVAPTRFRVVRGGHYIMQAPEFHSASRWALPDDLEDRALGFRVAVVRSVK